MDGTGARTYRQMTAITDPHAARAFIRSGAYTGGTAGIAPDRVQGNVCILPRSPGRSTSPRSASATRALARSSAWARRATRGCPTSATSTSARTCRATASTATASWRASRPTSWTCGRTTWSHSCWAAASPLNCRCCRKASSCSTSSAAPSCRCTARRSRCVPAGPFKGTMVVSMRPLKPADAIRAVQITSRFPAVHGAPVHIGFPEAIGIRDIMRPEYGDAPVIGPGELPVFWGCGVTPQVAVEAARPAICITHAPGAMLLTDKLNATLAAF